MVSLGGNIEIINFDHLEPGKLIVVKKIFGNYAKKAAESSEFKRLILELTEGETVTIHATLEDKSNHSVKMSDTNLFFALHKALEGLSTAKGL